MWKKFVQKKIDSFKNNSLSTNTVTRKINDLSNNLNSQVNNTDRLV